MAVLPRVSQLARFALGALGLALVFVMAAAAGVVLHADLPPAQRLIGRVLSRTLTHVLTGTVQIDSLELVSASRIVVPKAVLLDAAGHPVLMLSDVRVDISLRRLMKDFVLTAGRPKVIVDHVRVQRADVDLVPDPETGEPTIVSAMTPLETGGPSSGDGSDAPRVFLPVIELGHVVGHATFRNQPPFEADIRNVRGQLFASGKGLAVDVQRFGAKLTGYGTEARGTGTLAVRAPGPLRGTFEGYLGDVELMATVFLHDHHLELTASVPSASPAAMGALIPDWPIRKPISGQVELKGNLPLLEGKASLLMGSSGVLASGPVHLGKHPDAELSVEVHRLDLTAFADDVPSTALDATGKVNLSLDDGRLVAKATAHTKATTLTLPETSDAPESRTQEIPIPETDLTAEIADGNVTGTAEIHEPGSRVHAEYSVTKDGVVDLAASSSGFDVGRSRRTASFGIAGRARGNARLHLENKELRVTFAADGTAIATKGLSARSLHVEGRLQSPSNAPGAFTGTVSARAERLDISGVPMERATLSARGNRSRVQFDATANGTSGVSGEAAGTADIRGKLVLRGTNVSLRRGGIALEGRIEELTPEDQSIELQSFRVTGAGGDMHGRLVVRKTLLEATARGTNLDLDALGKAFNLPPGMLGGKIRLDLDVAAGKDVERGSVRIGLRDATLGPIRGVSLHASVKLDGRKISGGASGLVREYGKLGASWDASLGGPAYELSSYEGVLGGAEIQLTECALEKLRAFLPEGGPISRIAGKGFARIRLERTSSEAPLPNVFATVATEGLEVDVAREGTAPLQITGVDVSATGSADGTVGNSSGAVRLADGRGDLVTASFNVQLDPAALRKDPALAWKQLLVTPVDVTANVPARPIALLPAFLGTENLLGVLRGRMSLGGSLSQPTLSGGVEATGFGVATTLPDRVVDLRTEGSYLWNSRALTLLSEASLAGRMVGRGEVRATFPNGDVERWIGETRLVLSDLPLDVIPALAESQVRGRITGTVSASRLGGHEDSGAERLNASLHVNDTTVAGARLGEGLIDVGTRGSDLVSHLSIVEGASSIDVAARAGWLWPGMFPELSTQAPAGLHVKAKSFAVAGLAPVLRGVVSHLTGKMNADVTATMTPRPGAGGPTWSSAIEGTADVTDGTALIDLLGIEVKDISLHAEADGGNGRSHIAVKAVRGRVRSGHDNLRGAADFSLVGPRLASGLARLSLSDVPLLFRGAPQGRATGNMTARFTREPERMRVDLDIPKLGVRLPQSSSRNVIDLAEHRDVVVIQEDEKREAAGDALPWRLVFHLGSDVNVRRSDVDISVSGTPTLDLGGDPVLSGTVDLVPGGRVPVLGKVFNVDHGRVIFDTGENDDPRLDVSASWRSQGDVTIYAGVTGTLKDARIRLRSDPPRPETEVYALLFGGTPREQAVASRSSGKSGQSAVALSAGVGALGVNEFLQNSPVELRVDSTAQSKPRYTAAVRVRPNLWFEASTYQQSRSTEGVASNKNVVSGTLDYRFHPRWSLRTEVGTIGGNLDLLWQYRY